MYQMYSRYQMYQCIKYLNRLTNYVYNLFFTIIEKISYFKFFSNKNFFSRKKNKKN